MRLKEVFRRLMEMMGNKLWIYLSAIFLMTGAHAGFGIAGSYLLKSIMEAAQRGSLQGLWKQVAGNLCLGLFMLFIWRSATIQYNIEAKRAIANLERQVFRKSVHLPMSYYENNHSGDFMSKLIYDVTKAGDVYGSRFRRLVAPVLSVLVYLVPMLILCWQVTAVLLLVNVLALFLNSVFVKPMKELGKVLSSNNADMTEKLTNLLAGIDLTKIFSAGGELAGQYKSANTSYLKTEKKRICLSAMLESVNQGLDFTSVILFLIVGVYFVQKNVTTIGSLAAIYAMYGSFVWQFLQIGRYMPELTNCLANAQRVFEFLDSEEEPERYEGGTAVNPEEYIAFEQVGFSYDQEREILKEFTMSVKKGSTVALTGESGKGKSTVAKLLLGFYPVKSGRIILEGEDFSNYSLKDIRDKIAYVPQEPYLFEASIAENISYGKPGAGMEEIMNAAKAANAHEFILRMEKGYDSIPGERGNTLSGGEKQRIAIARAILKNAPILLLDEATSALDNESEKLVSGAIERLMEGKTTIMIAHRPSTIARADRVIQLK